MIGYEVHPDDRALVREIAKEGGISLGQATELVSLVHFIGFMNGAGWGITDLMADKDAPHPTARLVISCYQGDEAAPLLWHDYLEDFYEIGYERGKALADSVS